MSAKKNGQAARLFDHLASGNTVTRLTALTELGIFELSARVIDIEARGYTVPRKTVKITNRWGETVRVTEYGQPYISGIYR